MSQADKTLWEAYEKRETWCMVEKHPNQYWDRHERRHFSHQTRSVLNRPQPQVTESRSAWANVNPPHREKRHFFDAGKSHLV
ncbi:hypothetical protein GDO86_009064 [Hymenochirus boettgeri]|uniref:Uncharacterized protein n=1 Tax=Hymenochirus boettgeri TaxID=247094 RepID=A0A8T2JEJ9_9PIPI|nr:hypothetical protein GDO86_009064 [Hymenochirus boettgeri]